MDQPVEHEDEPAAPKGKAWTLECMPTRSFLIRDLASGMTQVAAAAKYGVTQPAVSMFAGRHAARIAAIAADVENEYAGIWIADRNRRIEVYEKDAELLDRYITAAADEGMELDTKLIRTKHAAVRAVAEELGQLRTVIDHTATVRYELIGVDSTDLT